MTKTLILCDCSKTQSLDAKSFEGIEGVKCSKVHTGLCTQQTADAAKYINKGNAVIACLQESTTFQELADELAVDPPEFVDIRDRAGWSDQGDKAGPKMAALVSDTLLPEPMQKTVDVVSEGMCLIIGSPEIALPAAEQLSEILGVTALLSSSPELPVNRGFDIVLGGLKSASGTLGNFEIRIDAFQSLNPAGRGAMAFSDPRSGAISHCDIILDLSGETPLFPAPEKRDGYLRPDPGDPNAVATAVFNASHMIGTFEKPLYLSYDPNICAHSRAQQTGCSKCLDVCPTSAISPDGDNVVIDPMVCAGCGACSALCPSGAITYDAPPVSHLFRRIQNLSAAFTAAGGNAPQLLVHDAEFGAEMISLSARFSRGLPADVIPIEVSALAGFGHAEMLTALATGFTNVHILLAPKAEADVIFGEMTLANTIAGAPLVSVIDVNDPEVFCDTLYAVKPSQRTVVEPILPIGGRRDVTRLSAKALQPDLTDPITLPAGAPYGAVVVDTEACTLCLSCASLCPSGALGDNPDMPQLRFQETACLQCGLCETVCPENAITLQPQLDLADNAFNQVVLHEEEPFACIECGSLFGVKSTIERIVAQLEGKHSMFASSDSGKLIRMCDNCRINAKFHDTDNPFQGGERPKTRTTDDYIKARKDH
jgi:ferredoxin